MPRTRLHPFISDLWHDSGSVRSGVMRRKVQGVDSVDQLGFVKFQVYLLPENQIINLKPYIAVYKFWSFSI